MTNGPSATAVALALRDRYRVHAALCGAEAITPLRAHRIALIILDALLGPERGLDFVARFRAVQPAPILLLTAHGSTELLAQALRLKVDDYQEKPISVPTLRATVDRLVAPPPQLPDLATRARQCLEAYPPKPLDLPELAHQLGVSEVHLRRLFRMAYGKTPRRYVLECRMKQAVSLLRTTDDRIEAIAADAGFPSSAQFDRAFRAAMGMAPSDYRASVRTRST
jgi:AraC-like DNA-binding protein